jgi:hypothetical protein
VTAAGWRLVLGEGPAVGSKSGGVCEGLVGATAVGV